MFSEILCMCRRSSSRSIFAMTMLAVTITCHTILADGSVLDSLLESDPQIPVPKAIHQLDPAMKALWLSALESSEIDMQRMAAETVARSHEVDGSDLTDAIPALEKILQAKSSHPTSRFAAARALISLNSRSSSDKLFEASKIYGADLRHLIEPALAKWDHGPARGAWINRLGESPPRRRDLMLAIQSLGIVREQKALPQLLAIVLDLSGDPDLRFEAAKAVGKISPTGLETQALKLAQAPRTPTSLNQLCAIQLLSQHQSDTALQQLITLANDTEPLIAATAMRQLNEINSELMTPLAEVALQHVDSRVRKEGIHSCITHHTPERVVALGQRLSDPDPGLRKMVREGLSRLYAHAELKDSISKLALDFLEHERWKGQEQAAILSGEVDLKAAANRLVVLLESPRNEVNLAAAWAIRKIAVKETIPAILDKARRQTERRKDGVSPAVDEQVALLFEALGVMQASEALPLLKEYIPKQQFMGVRSRSAAIWAIGKIKQGDLDAELEDALTDRILDFEDKPPELAVVKQMAAISLARMTAIKQASRMRELAINVPLPVELGVALRWAVKELTGEEIAPPQPIPLPGEDWFLVPVP